MQSLLDSLGKALIIPQINSKFVSLVLIYTYYSYANDYIVNLNRNIRHLDVEKIKMLFEQLFILPIIFRIY